MAQFNYEDLKLKDYKECWDYQENKLKDIVAQKHQTKLPTSKNSFILVEHPHVYTIGKSGNSNNLLIQDDFLKKIEAKYYKINRGGDITYHGPGQLVGYPIIDLEYYKIGIREYIEKMEDSIIDTIANYGIKGERKNGATGVWIDAELKNKARKICAIGVRASNFVTMHGFALNVNTDMQYFNYINPCGFENYGVTSIQKETQSEISMEEVKSLIKKYFNKNY